MLGSIPCIYRVFLAKKPYEIKLLALWSPRQQHDFATAHGSQGRMAVVASLFAAIFVRVNPFQPRDAFRNVLFWVPPSARK